MGFKAGSCTINAFAVPSVKASACPVVPPPLTMAHTLYLSSLCVTFNAHIALSRSWIRPNTLLILFPFTRISPVPCTKNTLAVLVFRLPNPDARPSGSTNCGRRWTSAGWKFDLYISKVCCNSRDCRAGWILFRRRMIWSALWYLAARTGSPTTMRNWSVVRQATRGISDDGRVGTLSCFRIRERSLMRPSVKEGWRVK